MKQICRTTVIVNQSTSATSGRVSSYEIGINSPASRGSESPLGFFLECPRKYPQITKGVLNKAL
jgi:hypothetical protein